MNKPAWSTIRVWISCINTGVHETFLEYTIHLTYIGGKKLTIFSSATMVYQSIFHQTFLSFLLCITTLSLVASDPTDGFTRLQLSSSNFQVQRPYDVPQDQRYTFSNGVHRFIVYNTDKPHTSTSQTKPRTEIRITVWLNFDVILIIHLWRILLLHFNVHGDWLLIVMNHKHLAVKYTLQAMQWASTF